MIRIEKSDNFILIIFSILICYLTKDMYMFNTSDFLRTTSGILDTIPNFDSNLSLNYKILDDIQPFYKSYYKSSFTLIVYLYSVAISLITDYFDMRIYSAIFKTIYIFSLFYLFIYTTKIKSRLSIILFISLCTLMISSSNISMFSSFYQEQVVLVFLPLLILCLRIRSKHGYLMCFVCYTIISCSKSQMFYLPIIMLAYFIVYDRKRVVLNVSFCLISFIISTSCVIYSSGTIKTNQYHSTYFGTYLYIKENNLELPNGIDKNCIGIDAWGNKFNYLYGAENTEIGESCITKNNNETFKNTLVFFLKNPINLIKLPFDKGITTQLTEDYFHVYKYLKLIINSDSFTGSITKLKDFVFGKIRFPTCMLVMIASLFFIKKRFSGQLFIISSFATSQFYVSFFGEGYRDLNKHIFTMNYSFDLIVFLLLCYILSKIPYINTRIASN